MFESTLGEHALRIVSRSGGAVATLCVAAVLVAGCSTRVPPSPGAESAAPFDTSTANGATPSKQQPNEKRLWNPCSVPNSALRAAKLDPSTTMGRKQEFGRRVCSWSGFDPASNKRILALVIADTQSFEKKIRNVNNVNLQMIDLAPGVRGFVADSKYGTATDSAAAVCWGTSFGAISVSLEFENPEPSRRLGAREQASSFASSVHKVAPS
ncbi:DUF3558 family protein [Gordonia araii]|uniref:DUF3558 family protein n=1 Tax=Gordonia araii TaxID=263909 RepID=UPI000A06E316|nr:DUF3558 domain-containing protein [Gordonia araii NBRC 100433]